MRSPPPTSVLKLRPRILPARHRLRTALRTRRGHGPRARCRRRRGRAMQTDAHDAVRRRAVRLMEKITTREPLRAARLPRHRLVEVRDGAVSSPSRDAELHAYSHATPIRVVHIGARVLSQAPAELKRLETRVLARRHISCILVPLTLRSVRLRSAIQPRRFNGYHHTSAQLRLLPCCTYPPSSGHAVDLDSGRQDRPSLFSMPESAWTSRAGMQAEGPKGVDRHTL
ncbi:hypothetical protein K466DRAFT_337090 [Polyporus arcularius HHB13444]|uniref:Uncharacterized protein n=1 Tax=Polyporus arcularius HHB13444 TaxID=1314778 RepID=A0A5C3NXH1_9APHY|nr:hypothetical protein K466DRAFT_337090 [Polyporus arcularius HHB13444]